MNIDSSITTDLSTPAADNQDRSREAARSTRSNEAKAHPVWARIAWLEPIWLALLAPAILLPGRFWQLSWQPMLVLALFAFWPLRRLAYGRWSVSTSLAWPVGILMAWTPLTLWIAVDRPKAWIAVGYLLLGVAIYWAAINWLPVRKHPLWLVLPLALTGIVLAILGPQLLDIRQGSQLVRLPGLYARVGLLVALVGESMNGNVLAGGLVVIVPVMAALTVEPRWTRRLWLPVLTGVLAVGCLLPLFLTQSRGALLATLLALLVLLILRWPKLIWTLPLVFLAAGYAVFRLGIDGVLDALSNDTSLVGLSGRIEIWDRALLALRDFPWTGVGHGQFLPIVPELYPFFTLPVDIPHAHNLFLQIGIDMGLVGMIAYGTTVVIALVMAARSLRHANRGRVEVRNRGRRWQRYTLNWALGAGVIAALVGLLLHGLVDAVLWNTKLAFLPWLLFAQATLISMPERRMRRGGRRSSVG